MKRIKLYIYSEEKNSQTLSILPHPEYENQQIYTRLIAEDGYFLTNGKSYCNIVNVRNEDIHKWGEYPKEDFKHLFEDEFKNTKDESFLK